MPALPCIKCERGLQGRQKEGKINDPWYGVVFQSLGNVGSMNFGELDLVEINVCDNCLDEAVKKKIALLNQDEDDEDEIIIPQPPLVPKKPQLRLIKGEG